MFVPGTAVTKGSLADRFWSKVRRGPGCWEWTACTDPNGYGRFSVGGQSRKAPRVAYELTYGRIPVGQQTRHTCDNPPCCRPRHLRLGTQADNMADMYARRRNRQPKGERAARSKLTARQVRRIRTRYAVGGISQRELGR